MVAELTINEFSQLLTGQTGGRANHVFSGELLAQANPTKTILIDVDDAEPSHKHMRFSHVFTHGPHVSFGLSFEVGVGL